LPGLADLIGARFEVLPDPGLDREQLEIAAR
jgi:hypothetical protein